MKKVMIAAFTVASLSTAATATQPVGLPSEPIAAAQSGHGSEAQESPGAAAPRDEVKPRKRRSTGDKVLTGAAVILSVGALAVGGLLVAIFVA